MNNAIFSQERPQNEHTLSYAPGCKERKSLNAELDRLSSEVQDIPLIIGGKEVRTGKTERLSCPMITSMCLQIITRPVKKRCRWPLMQL
jgi:1-pyrroline-5-carboxylate dehydrogenase